MTDIQNRLRVALTDSYRLTRELGRGGMATVFLGEDIRHNRPVAIKVLDPDLSSLLGPDRFRREVAIAARLAHPNIVSVYDSGAGNGLLYYVMPFVEGESLRERLLRERTLPVEDARDIAREVGEALDYAHHVGVVHRDIKPENILLAHGHALLTDFGIARAVDVAAGDALTSTGITLGTPLYMSPEQSAGEREVGPRSDEYSLACVVYEMLSGQPPFSGSTVDAVSARHRFDTVPPIRTVRPSVSPSVEAAVVKALSKNPVDRFDTMGEFVAALEAGEAPGPPVASEPLSVPMSKRTRGKWVVAVATLVLAILVAVMLRSRGYVTGAPKSGAAPRRWVLVSHFSGSGANPELLSAARSVVASALLQSAIVQPVPDDQVRIALQQAGLDESSALTPQVARELAYRRSVRGVLEGKVDRVGAQYAVQLALTDVDGAAPLAAARATAIDEKTLIPTLEKASRELLRNLGEDPRALEARRPLVEVATPSFEAFRLYARSVELMNDALVDQGDVARPLLGRAIQLDPDFAAAYLAFDEVYRRSGRLDSSRWALREALRRPGRLTEVQRLDAEAALARLAKDYPRAIALSMAALKLGPNDVDAVEIYSGLAITQLQCGRFQDAVESAHRMTRLPSFASDSGFVASEVFFLIEAGRLDEARRLARSLQGGLREAAEGDIAITGEDWSALDSLGTRLGGAAASGTRCVLLAIRGQAFEADERIGVLIRSLEPKRGAMDRRLARVLQRNRDFLALMTGRRTEIPPPSVLRDTSIAGLITRCYSSAVRGDLPAAKRLLRKIEDGPADQLLDVGGSSKFLEALVLWREGRFGDAIQALGPVAGGGLDIPSFDNDCVSVVQEQWLIAQCFEALRQPDSAASYYERVLHPVLQFEGAATRLPASFAHQRLVVLYAGLGREADARRHWTAFSKTFTRPDPDLRRLIDQARAALERRRAPPSRGARSRGD
jgi:tetratricopeptide (TPR) repeat protein